MTTQSTASPTRTGGGVRGRALLAALGLALAAAVLPAAVAHASPQAPDTSNQLTNLAGDVHLASLPVSDSRGKELDQAGAKKHLLTDR